MSYQREYEKRISVALVGVGSHSIRNILPTLNFLPVRLLAVCDVNAELAKKTAVQYGCNYYTSTAEMYRAEKALEAVFIVVGPELHPTLVIEALGAGLHVWVEKPVALIADEVERMLKARGDRIVVVGLKKAFMPAALKAREIAYSEKYGNLRSILAVYHMTVPDMDELGGTHNWLRNGVHPLAFMMYVGGSVEEVTAITNDLGHGAVILRFKTGVMGTLHLSSGPQPNVETYGVYGDCWQLEINNARIELKRGIPFQYSYTANYAPAGDDSGSIVWDTSNCLATLENKAEFTQGIYGEMKYFCDCVLEGKQPEDGTLEFAHEMMKVYEAGILSKGRPIKVLTGRD